MEKNIIWPLAAVMCAVFLSMAAMGLPGGVPAGKEADSESVSAAPGRGGEEMPEGSGSGEAAGLSETASCAQTASIAKTSSAAKTASYAGSAEGAEALGPAPEETRGEVLVTLGFAGDLNLSEGWETTVKMDSLEKGILDCFSEKTLEEMRAFDLFMVNNEFAYSKRGEKSPKSYTFRADPERVENLKTLGVDIVLTANNHVNDYGEEALLDTLDTLDEAGISRVGAGRNLEEAASPVCFDLYGRKIAYVAASCAEEHEDTVWTTPAGEDSPGILGCYEPEAFLRAVREAAEQADFVIACVHWGYEYLDYYTEEQEEMAGRLVRAGADAVIGTHPHVLQGVEFIGGAPVFYSLGNFWFSGEDLMTGMAQLTLRIPADPKEKVELAETKFIPCTQYGLYTAEAEEEREQILQHMRDISFGTKIDEDGTAAP